MSLVDRIDWRTAFERQTDQSRRALRKLPSAGQ